MTIDNSQIPTTNQVNLTKDVDTGEKFLNQYKLIKKLGNGHNGKVYLGENIYNGEFYAIKEISKVSKISILNKDPDYQINKINNEINIMKLIIKHPKILKLYEILNDLKFNKIFLILEYCSKGELKFGPTINYSIFFLKMIIRDVVLGLEYLNGIGIIHRGIKPSNLLINNDNFIKISDFGISINKFNNNNLNFEKKISNFGTPAFSPPELCNGSNFNKIDGKIDVWSLGITIYCLYYGKLPFNGSNEYELFNEIINNEVFLPKTDDVDLIQLNDLLFKMLIKNPIKRYSIHDVKSHKFLSSNFDHDSNLQFLKFNEYYLFKRESNLSNFAKNSSNTTLSKFKSIFIRKSSISKNQNDFNNNNNNNNNNPLASTSSLPTKQNSEKEEEDDTTTTMKRFPITQPNSLVSTAPTSPVSTSPPNIKLNRVPTPTPITRRSSTSSSTSSSPSSPQSPSSPAPTPAVSPSPSKFSPSPPPHSTSPPPIKTTDFFTRPPLRTSKTQVPSSTTSTTTNFPKRPPLRSKESQIASSTNSLNLNSLLKSKKDVPNYLDDSTFFQSVDSELSSSDSESEDDDEDGGMIYNDVEDTLSIRIGPKRQTSSLGVKTMHEYLGIWRTYNTLFSTNEIDCEC